MKPRTCPSCKKPIPVDHGFSFDENLNMICGHCGKVVVGTTWDKEPSSLTAPVFPETYHPESQYGR